jgi:hypothetical protein
MQFFPHNIPTSKVYGAISASSALSSSLINNFAAVPVVASQRVSTASVALNITGARGTDGTSVAIYGPTGSVGDRGVTGFRGNSIYLLSASWHDFASTPCAPIPPACYSLEFYTVYEIGGGLYSCDFSETPPYNPTTLYTTTDPNVTPFDSGFPMFQDSLCTTQVGQYYIMGAVNYGANPGLYRTLGTNNSFRFGSCSEST